MITFVAVIDKNRGMANDHGIPWAGKLPTDLQHYRGQNLNHTVLMGYTTYLEQSWVPSKVRNLVVNPDKVKLKPGYELIRDPIKFLTETKEDVMVLGGAMLFQTTLDLADRLDLTILNKEFDCTKFFPEYERRFRLVSQSQPITENEITYRFTIWQA